MDDTAEHWRRLEKLYLTAPTNAYYKPAIRIGNGICEIEVDARPDFHHAAHAVHGSVYFKLLDDADYFRELTCDRRVCAHGKLHDPFAAAGIRGTASGERANDQSGWASDAGRSAIVWAAQ
ncbi:MAG TPA: hypothetical protein VEK79_19470 [Thermoanaerobaculia bacterium]|nr:hypothetical protein [Thermoanaerobaculia bacterium]